MKRCKERRKECWDCKHHLSLEIIPYCKEGIEEMIRCGTTACRFYARKWWLIWRPK